MENSYNISLPHFEGPFDLLLFFIERDELDIYDIPIFKLSSDFLDYIKELEHLNINVASEFIFVASSLMRIKAKMLLPRKELDEEGNEIDPREELIQRILEYKKYKGVLNEFKVLETDRTLVHNRSNIRKELSSIAEVALVDVELEQLSLYKLMKTFERILDKYDDRNRKVIHKVVQYTWTIRDTKKYLSNKINTLENKLSFDTLFDECEDRIHAIFYFLSVLELIQLQEIALITGEKYNNFWLTSCKTES